MVIRSQGLQLIEWRSWGWNKQEAAPSTQLYVESAYGGKIQWNEEKTYSRPNGGHTYSWQFALEFQFAQCLVCLFVVFIIKSRGLQVFGRERKETYGGRKGEEMETVKKKDNERWLEKSKRKWRMSPANLS